MFYIVVFKLVYKNIVPKHFPVADKGYLIRKF
jgi:hypothetical protein